MFLGIYRPIRPEPESEGTAGSGQVPPSGEVGFDGNYQVFGDRVEVTDGNDTFTARWTVEDGSLVLGDLVTNGDPEPSPYSVVHSSHPWTRDDG